ncbi:hypothetical protein IAU60_006417 [Kwoniella sp. DSM 27419]
MQNLRGEHTSASPDHPGESSTQAGAQAGRVARYGSSCVACRRRKQRCDAQTPSCGRCLRLKEECVYEGNTRNQPSPHLAPLLVKTFDFLHSLVAAESTEPDAALRPIIRRFLAETKIPNFARKPAGSLQDSTDGSEGETPALFTVKDQPESEEDDQGGHADMDELLMHMSLADNGQNGHFGITSLFYQTPSDSVVQRLQRRLSKSATRQGGQRAESSQTVTTQGRYRPELPVHSDESDEVWATDDNRMSALDDAGILKANASMLGGWESLAYHKLELESDAANAKMITYFCWQYGSHCVVYRPVFIRDMALGGPYFNHLLLNVICAHATRYSDYHQQMGGGQGGSNGMSTPALAMGSEFMNRAKLLLATEMDKVSGSNLGQTDSQPSSVPTIQALLLLGQRECACGNLSQGWMYTGMAFRAMRDLGIHLDCNRLPIFGFGTMSAEDREIRRRLFWSAFTWDKVGHPAAVSPDATQVISLALGRTPTFNAWSNASPGPIVDDTEDDLEWVPYFWDDKMPLELVDYPKQKSLMTLNFRHFIKLCEIIQKIIMRLYDGRPTRLRNHRFVDEMRGRLTAWMDELPAGLKLEVHALPEHCPPPHIFSTKTPAPTRLTQIAEQTCTRMAEELHQLFLLYAKSFKLRNMTYTLSWSMSPDPAVSASASPRLSMALHVLERGSLQTPGTQRSIEIIKQRLRTPRPHLPKRLTDHDGADEHTKRAHTDNEVVMADIPLTVLDATSGNDLNMITPTQANLAADLDLTQYAPIGPSPDHPQLRADEEDDVIKLWAELMQHEGNGNGSMDLLQGMMAMPSAGSVSQYQSYAQWTPE